ncbi:MAG: UDP-N-acetylglucosamine 1-carboxyvinyltransferase 1 [Patescibacteria group bacterium]|nr:MAG: UDP-N-acetylglucosamine 1-carboxyvinyltransferase 1 [Patescibacteria group bacterium]
MKNLDENVYIVNGGRLLEGEVKVAGGKNSSLKLLIASLLFDSDVVLKNIPQIRDVFEVLHIIDKLGGSFEWIDDNTLKINSSSLSSNTVDLLHGSKVRVSFMFLAPLLYRFGECYVPNPGGCRIGARPIDRIINGVKALGVHVEYNSETGYYYLKKTGPIAGRFRFNKPSHTGTETLIMLSAFSDDKVVIENSALEPEVDELIAALQQAGVDIKRSENNPSTIETNPANKSKGLKLNSDIFIKGDHNEAVSYAVLGLITGKRIRVAGAEISDYQVFLDNIAKAKAEFKIIDSQTAEFYKSEKLQPVDIQTAPYPGFKTDWQAMWSVLMTQANGQSKLSEYVFEDRFGYVAELRKLGAKIEFVKTPESEYDKFQFNLDPNKKDYYQTILINGPVKLHNGVVKVNDLRAGACLVIASLAAEGQSIIDGADIVERGYHNFDAQLRELGADIIKK